MSHPQSIIIPNIILIGLMGCGKTTVGKYISRTCKLKFIDTDQMIEKQSGMSIPTIFKVHGEAYFRSMETEVLKKIATKKSMQVISTGGGIIIHPENRELLKTLGFVVWLKTDVDTLYQRVAKCTNRPLLRTANPKEVLSKLIAEREPFYQETAHLVIDTANLNVDELAYGILESARVFHHHD